MGPQWRGVGAVIVVGGAQTASQPPLGGGKGGGRLSAQQGTVASMEGAGHPMGTEKGVIKLTSGPMAVTWEPCIIE